MQNRVGETLRETDRQAVKKTHTQIYKNQPHTHIHTLEHTLSHTETHTHTHSLTQIQTER